MLDSIGQHAGTMINAAAFIVVVFLLAFFGLRPMATALTNNQGAEPATAAFGGGYVGPSFEEMQASLPSSFGDYDEAPAGLLSADSSETDDLRFKLRPAPQDRLARMVDINEERTALILRKWAAREPAEAAA